MSGRAGESIGERERWLPAKGGARELAGGERKPAESVKLSYPVSFFSPSVSSGRFSPESGIAPNPILEQPVPRV